MLALMAALVGPYFIDWTSYRADFEREASAVLGRKVTVEGAASARILPFPSVTFSDVTVGGTAGGEPAMTIGTFSMDAELAPFLRGEFLIFDMRLVRPKGIIDVAADGVVDWAERPSAPFDVSRISLEKLTVTDGEVEIRHSLSGRSHLLSEINTTISAKSLAGPWRLDGALSVDGVKTGLSASTGTVDETGSMRMRLRAEPVAHAATIEADGNIRITDGLLDYSGQFKILQARPAAAGDAAAAKAADDRGPGFRVNGQFSVGNKGLEIPEFRFATGPLDNPYTADGKASVDFGAAPRFSVTASGAQVRFDEAIAGSQSASLSLVDRLNAVEAALAGLPKPGMPGTIEVDLPAVVVGDTTIRDVRLSAEPAEGGWSIRSAGATLPGRTTLEANGFLATGDAFGFSGSLLLAVAQPSGFAAWVATDIDDAIRRLPAAGFNAKVEMSGERQTFRDLELVLGNAQFRGEIDSSLPDDSRPSVSVKLDGGALDVDGLSAFAALFVSDAGRARFAGADVDFAIKAGPVTVGGVTADTLDTTLRLRDRLLEIDRLAIGGLAGASVSATGKIRDFPESPTGNLDATIVSVDLAPLIALAAAHSPDNPVLAAVKQRISGHSGLFTDTQIDLVASAATNDDQTTGMALSLQGNLGGSAVSATLSGKGSRDALADATVALSVSARNDDATKLLALIGLPVLPIGTVGAGDLALSAQGIPATGLETEFKLTGDQLTASFAGTTGFGAQGPVARGKALIEAGDIEPWMMTIGVALPGMGMGMPIALAADADYASGLLVLGGLSGTIDENAVSGDINARLEGGIPHLTGALTIDALAIDPFAAMTLGEAAVADVEGEWPSVPFSPKPSTPFTADLDITADTLAVGTIASAYDASMSLRFNAEEFRVSDLKAKFQGGELSGLFDLKNSSGTGLFSGQFQLRDADLATALAGTGLAGTGTFSTVLSGSGKSIEGVVATLSGSGSVAASGLRIDGMSAEALPALLAKADAAGRDIDAARTAVFTDGIAGAGIFDSADAEVAFTVASGVMRAPPVTFANPLATISADMRADLNTGLVSAGGTITYAPGDEALAGSEPMLRFSLEGRPGALTRTFDSEPLAQFLTQRALEKEQARVEAMQAALMEKQRLRREVRYYAALQTERDRIEEEKRRAEEERLRAAEEARLRAEEEARRKLEAEQAAKAAEEARIQAEEEARLLVEAEAARVKAETEARQAQEAEEAAARAAQQVESGTVEAETANEAPKAAPAPRRAPAAAPKANAAPPEDLRTRKLEPFSIDSLFKTLRGG